MNDQSGTYRDLFGPTSVACVRQAVQDFGSTAFDVEIVAGDHQNRPDVASALARRWLDLEGVDMLASISTSNCALAVNTICREKNKVMLCTGAGILDLTGAQCSPNTIHWSFDNYMSAKATTLPIVRNGGDSWFFIAPNYAFGQQMRRIAGDFVTESGGRVLGSVIYPFPDTTDFSAFLLQAQASGAKVLGLCAGGADTINLLKQSREFGVTQAMQIANMSMFVTEVNALGLEAAQGLLLAEAFYWDLNERTRAFAERIRSKIALPPNMMQAGDYSATLHYLKTVADIGPAEAKRDGAALVARMRAMPTDDDCFGRGSIRTDGRKIHPCYLFRAKAPSESRNPWDLLTHVGTTPAEEAFRPLAEGGCPLVRN